MKHVKRRKGQRTALQPQNAKPKRRKKNKRPVLPNSPKRAMNWLIAAMMPARMDTAWRPCQKSSKRRKRGLPILNVSARGSKKTELQLTG